MNSIELFLQSVCRFVSTEEKAKDIRDELQDHISNYIEEYMDEGMDLNQATNEALKQMGDPSMLSEFYKEEPYSYKRIFKIILVSIFSFTCVFSKFIHDKLNNSNMIVTYILMIIFILCYGYFIFEEIKLHKMKVQFSIKDPIFYIQNYKASILNEKLDKGTWYLFAVIGILNLILFVTLHSKTEGKFFYSQLLNNVTICSSYIILALMTSITNYNKDKSIVYADGIFALDDFISWDDIQGYRWEQIRENDKIYNLLEINLKGDKILSRKVIKVSSFQVNLIEELFLSKNIEKKRYF